MEESEESSRATVFFKYFIHGILFSALTFVLTLVWGVILAMLAFLGSIIGLLIGVVLLFFIYGGVNAYLTQSIWDIYVKSDWQSILRHGFYLFIFLLIASIPNIIINLVLSNLAISIVLFVVFCFINGFIARELGFWFEADDSEAF